MSEQTTTTLTAEQVAAFHDALEAHDDDLLSWAARPTGRLLRPLPKCPACAAFPTEVRMGIPAQADGSVTVTFDACGHAFHADCDVMAEGLRIHNGHRRA